MPAKEQIDVIILSFAKSNLLKNLTIQTIESLLASEDPELIHFNIVVIESNATLRPYTYDYTTTVYPKSKFGYNKYLNVGIKCTKNTYICLCNNDLIFHKNWATQILITFKNDQGLLSASPYCPKFHTEEGIEPGSPTVEGYFGVLTGWCIFLKREIFNVIGLLDENLMFWYSDADFCQTLIKFGIRHILVPTSIVTHLGSESFKRISEVEKQKLSNGQKFYYDYKWRHHSLFRYRIEKLIFKLKMLTKA